MERKSKRDYYLDIAYAVSARSTCLRRRYGCIIVKNDKIVATGYNGSARGEVNCCDRGTCPRMNMSHNSGDYSDCNAIHAEQNAMLSASRDDLDGATCYLSGEELTVELGTWKRMDHCTPCPICERMIRNSGIKAVVGSK